MQKYTASVIWLVCLLVGLASTWSHASDGITLSSADEQAYQSAQAAWERLAKVHEEAGIPPPGDPPRRDDFIDYSAQRAYAVVRDTAARLKAETRWQQRGDAAKPYLRTLVRPNNEEARDYRTKIARQEKARLLAIADERLATQHLIEAQLEALAQKHTTSRVISIGGGRSAVLVGEIDGHPLWLRSLNQIAGASIGSDQLWPTNSTPWPAGSTGLELTGAGVTLGLWEVDGAVRESHSEFQGRVVQVDNNPDNPISPDYHATGVAGTMAAGGVVELPWLAPGKLARGVAYEAYVDAYDINEFYSELSDAAAGEANVPGLRLSNHSYGHPSGWQPNTPVPGVWSWWGDPFILEEPKFGAYSPDLTAGYGCTQLDLFLSIEAARHLLIFAAGNDRLVGPGTNVNYLIPVGTNWVPVINPPYNSRLWRNGDGSTYGFDTVIPPGTAKNVLTVGSVLDVFHTDGNQITWGYSTNSVVTLSSWSAAGPTDDGRIKPDIVAVGEADVALRGMPGLVTPLHDNDSDLQALSGTSLAAPAVTAGIGLMLQRRGQLFPSLDSDVDAWRGSTLKALAIHTADDIGYPGPSFLTGWGLFNAISLVRQVELDAFHGRGSHIKELFVGVHESISWKVYSDGSEPLKVTIAWSDPPGQPSTALLVDDPTPMLVNNLDLTIQNQAQTQTWMPWILDPDLTNKTEATRSAPATTGYDDRNNVEQVYIAEPDAGYYLITVANAGGHSGGPSPTAQWVSVISSGDIPIPPRSTRLEIEPSGDEILLTFESNPGAYLLLESTTDLNEPQTWNTVGQVVTESVTNAVLLDTDGELWFWRLRRETP